MLLAAAPLPCPAASPLPPGAIARLGEAQNGPVLDAAVSPDGSLIALATARGGLQLWRASDHTLGPVLRAETPAVSIGFSADGTRLAAAYSDGSVRLWDPRDGTLVRRLMVHPRATVVLALSPNGTILAGGGDDGMIQLVDAETANPLRRLMPVPRVPPGGVAARPAPARALAFAPDGGALASAHGPHYPFVHVWDPLTGREIARLTDQHNAAASVVFSPDGATVATAADTGQTITLWETATWRVRRKLDTRGMPERPATFSADGRSLWSTVANDVWRWDLPSGRRVRKFTGHRGEVKAVMAFPQGDRIVSAGDDGSAVIWNARSGPEPGATRLEAGDARPEGLWGALAAEDAAVAYDAIWALAATPERSIPYLRNRLPRQDAANAGHVRRLIAQLDDERFTVRERATKELAELGDAAEPLLREQLSTTKSPEVGQRIEVLLDALRHTSSDADVLRALRAAEVLERIGTPDARAALQELAAGTPSAKVKDRALGAVRRLDELAGGKSARQPAR